MFLKIVCRTSWLVGDFSYWNFHRRLTDVFVSCVRSFVYSSFLFFRESRRKNAINKYKLFTKNIIKIRKRLWFYKKACLWSFSQNWRSFMRNRKNCIRKIDVNVNEKNNHLLKKKSSQSEGFFVVECLKVWLWFLCEFFFWPFHWHVFYTVVVVVAAVLSSCLRKSITQEGGNSIRCPRHSNSHLNAPFTGDS